jgi:hypothetical protein
MIVILKEDLQFLHSLALIVWRSRVVLKIQVLIIVLIIVHQVRETTDLQRLRISPQAYVVAVRTETGCADGLSVEKHGLQPEIIDVVIESRIDVRYQLLRVLFSLHHILLFKLLCTLVDFLMLNGVLLKFGSTSSVELVI